MHGGQKKEKQKCKKKSVAYTVVDVKAKSNGYRFEIPYKITVYGDRQTCYQNNRRKRYIKKKYIYILDHEVTNRLKVKIKYTE